MAPGRARGASIFFFLFSLLSLAGCTTGVPGSGRDPGHPEAASVRIGVLGSPPTLDPYSPRATDLTWSLARPLFPSLFRFAPDGRSEPYLAESWEVSSDSLEIRLLPAGWSDGSPITATDVVTSFQRAPSPSGFARFGRARAVGESTVRFGRFPPDWRTQLARRAPILPQGGFAAGGPWGGPLRLLGHEPGLEMRFARNEAFFGSPAYFERVTVRFVQSHDILLALLVEGRLDAASVPSSINLEDRLEALGLEFSAALGWESIKVSFNPRSLSLEERSAIAGALDREVLEASFIREDGRAATSLSVSPGPGGARGPWAKVGEGAAVPDFSLAAPAGDELLALIQRAVYEQMKRSGVSVDVVVVDPSGRVQGRGVGSAADAILVRDPGMPGARGEARSFRTRSAMPLAQVETVMVWRPGLQGVVVNPAGEGPLWNIELWHMGSRDGE